MGDPIGTSLEIAGLGAYIVAVVIYLTIAGSRRIPIHPLSDDHEPSDPHNERGPAQ